MCPFPLTQVSSRRVTGAATVTEAFITKLLPWNTGLSLIASLEHDNIIMTWHHLHSFMMSAESNMWWRHLIHQSLVTSRYWQNTQHFKGFFKIHVSKFLAQYCNVCRFTLVLVSHKYSFPSSIRYRVMKNKSASRKYWYLLRLVYSFEHTVLISTAMAIDGNCEIANNRSTKYNPHLRVN